MWGGGKRRVLLGQIAEGLDYKGAGTSRMAEQRINSLATVPWKEPTRTLG